MVAWSWIARDAGVQLALIDVLVYTAAALVEAYAEIAAYLRSRGAR